MVVIISLRKAHIHYPVFNLVPLLLEGKSRFVGFDKRMPKNGHRGALTPLSTGNGLVAIM